MTDEAERLRAQKSASTDPERLEREAQLVERRQNAKFLCEMPGGGDWVVTAHMGSFVAASPVHGVFVLAIHTEKGALYGKWEKVKPDV